MEKTSWEGKPPRVQWSNHQNLSFIITDVQGEIIYRSKSFSSFLLSGRPINKFEMDNIVALTSSIKVMYNSIEPYLYKNVKAEFDPQFKQLQNMIIEINSYHGKTLPKGFLELVDFCSAKIVSLCVKANAWLQTDNDSFQSSRVKKVI